MTKRTVMWIVGLVIAAVIVLAVVLFLVNDTASVVGH